MQTVFSPLVNVYQTQLEASRRFADAIFSGTEKIDRVVLDSVHRVFNQQVAFAQAMASARDPQSAASTLQSNFLMRNPDDTLNYQKEIMRIFAEMQNELGKSLQDYIEQLGSNAASSAAMPLERAQQQAGEATVYNPVTSMFSVWESAFKEAATLAKKNMATARSSIEDATSRTMDRTAAFTTAASSAMEEAANVAGSSGLTGRNATGSDGEQADSERAKSAPSGGRRKQ
jgi:hypothetical protein